MRSFSFIMILLVGSAALLQAGCGNQGRQKVSGTVTFKGQPLDHGTIQFLPVSTEGEVTSGGAEIKDGKYEIPAKQGLLPGTYQVIISSGEGSAKAEEVPGESEQEAKERIPAEYNVGSRKTVEVKKGEANVFDFTIP